MRRDVALSQLKKYKHELHTKYRVTKPGIFGSLARDEARENSDVDIVVELERPDLFALSGIKCDLEEILQTPVDVIPYATPMNPFLKHKIDTEALYV
jgi:hypothetical protein